MDPKNVSNNLKDSIRKFTETQSVSAAREVIERHPELLEPRTVSFLMNIEQAAAAGGHDAVKANLEKHRNLLEHCIEHGVDAAFEEMLEIDAPSSFPLIIRSFLASKTLAEMRELILQHPILMDLGGFMALEAELQAAKGRGDSEIHHMIETRLRLLERCVEIGVDMAFKEVIASETSPLELTVRRVIDLQNQYLQTKNFADLEATAVAWRTVLTHQAFSSMPDRFKWTSFTESSRIFLDLYNATSAEAALASALASYENALGLPATIIEDQTILSRNNGQALLCKYLLTADLQSLERAIHVIESALEAADPSSPHRDILASDLARALLEKYNVTGVVTDLEAAIGYVEQGATSASPILPNRVENLNILGVALRAWYKRTGAPEALERAKETLERAISLVPETSAHYLPALTNVGHVYHDRYLRWGTLEDLDRASLAYETALIRMTSGSMSRAPCLAGLGAILRERFKRAQKRDDLERALQCDEEALTLVKDGSLDQVFWLNNLASTLRARFRHFGEVEDLRRAVQLFHKALRLAPATSPMRASLLNNLGNALRSQTPPDLTEAANYFQEAIKLTPPGSSELPGRLSNLASALRETFIRDDSFMTLEAARTNFRKACEAGLELRPEVTLEAAREWISWAFARETWEEAAEAGDLGLEAIERLAQSQVLRSEKETWLRNAQGLSTIAAYANVRSGQLGRAVEVVEAGQARLLAEGLERNRRDLERLGNLGAAALLERYRRASDRLREIETRPEGAPAPLAERSQARAELSATVDAIRSVPGYSDFLHALPYDRIRSGARSEPIIYLLATPAGGLALIVTAETTVAHDLPQLSTQALREQLWGEDVTPDPRSYLGAYARWRRSPDGDGRREAWGSALGKVSHWLHAAIFEPLLEALEGISAVTLVPCGLLALAPLQAARAAGYHPADNRPYVLDRLRLRFAANARSLLAGLPGPTESLFAVAEPQPVKAPPIPASRFEVAAVCARFPTSALRHLAGQAAYKDAVIEAIGSAGVFHFSGHASADLDHPLEGGLMLAHDQKLTLRELLGERLDGLRLAVLSACETAVPGTELPDEVIGLPAALAQAGVAAVIASSWLVEDASTALLMARFYEAWREDGHEPVDALHTAQLWLRDVRLKDLEGWIDTHRERVPSNVPLPQPPEEDRPFSDPIYWAAFSYVGS